MKCYLQLLYRLYMLLVLLEVEMGYPQEIVYPTFYGTSRFFHLYIQYADALHMMHNSRMQSTKALFCCCNQLEVFAVQLGSTIWCTCLSRANCNSIENKNRNTNDIQTSILKVGLIILLCGYFVSHSYLQKDQLHRQPVKYHFIQHSGL